jgi:hypothetical protein
LTPAGTRSMRHAAGARGRRQEAGPGGAAVLWCPARFLRPRRAFAQRREGCLVFKFAQT